LEEEKRQSPQLFNKIAQKYDRFNLVSSFGCDGVWRKKAARAIPRTSTSLIDIACGTGDQLFAALTARPNLKKVYGLDLANQMIDIARAKSQRKGFSHKVSWIHGSATQIPATDETLDTATLSFGIRNIPDPEAALTEIHRVLKKGGKLIILEFSIPRRKILRILHFIHIRFVLPMLGKIITGRASPYLYLAKTIQDFPYGAKFRRILEETGFQSVRSTPLAFGAVTLYEAVKA